MMMQGEIPWQHLDIDGILFEGPPEMLTSLLSPMAVELCAYMRSPDWQRGDGNWTAVVSGACTITLRPRAFNSVNHDAQEPRVRVNGHAQVS